MNPPNSVERICATGRKEHAKGEGRRSAQSHYDDVPCPLFCDSKFTFAGSDGSTGYIKYFKYPQYPVGDISNIWFTMLKEMHV